MALKSGSVGTGRKNMSIIKIAAIALIVVIVVFGVYTIATAFSNGAFGSADGSCGPAPAPYEAIRGQNVTIVNADGSSGAMFTVIRGIVGYGKPQIVDGKQPLTFPACYSSDKDLITITDVNIKMSDGTSTHLEVGVVVAPLSGNSNQPGTTTPTPAP